MNPEYEQKIQASRAANIPDNEIFEYLKKQPDVQEKYTKSISSGVPQKDVDSYLSKTYGLNVSPEPKKKSFLQSVYGALSYNPVAEGIEAVFGENPVSNSLKEVSQSIATGLPAGVLSAPRELINAPANIKAAAQEHRKNEPDYVKNDKVQQARDYVTDKALDALDYIPENTGLKNLANTYLPNYQEASEYFRSPEDEPKTHAGKFAERTVAGLSGGATTGNPALGAFVGAQDYIAEQMGVSPDRRAINSLMIAQAPRKTVHGQILPAENLPTIVKRGVENKINSANELAAKIVSGSPDNLNMPVLQAAYDLNMPLENIPMQSLYKGGLPNMLEGMAQNSMMAAGKFNKLLENFTDEMTSRTDEVINSMPIDTLEDVSNVQQLGEQHFENFLPEFLNKAAPALNIPKYQSGNVGTSALKRFDERITNQYKELYNSVKYNPNDLVRPSNPRYEDVPQAIKKVQKLLRSKGHIGKERQEALNVLSDISELFEPVMKENIVTGEMEPEKPNVKLEHIRKNVQDLHKKVNYEHPEVINLIMPVIEELNSILYDAAQTKPHLLPIVEANKLFGQKQKLLNDPIMRNLYAMTDEKFYQAVRRNPTYLKRLEEVGQATGEVAAVNELKAQIMADILEKPMKATDPKELISSITDGVIKEVRELEPFYPELKGLSQSLEDTKKLAKLFQTPQEQLKSTIRREVIEDIISDSDFTQTLNRMNTPEGIRLVRNVLNETREGKKLLKSLEKKKVEQALYNGPKAQEISLADLQDAFQNPKTDAILKELLSPDNYKQAKDLSKIAKGYEEGIKKGTAYKGKMGKVAEIGLVGLFWLLPIQQFIGVGALAYYLTTKNFKKALIDKMHQQYKSRNSGTGPKNRNNNKP